MGKVMSDRKSDWPWRVAFLCAGSAVALAWPNAVKLLAAVAVGLFVLASMGVLVVGYGYLLWLLIGTYYRATLVAVHGEYVKGLAAWLLVAVAVRVAWTSGGDDPWLGFVSFVVWIVSFGIAFSLADKVEHLRAERRKRA